MTRNSFGRMMMTMVFMCLLAIGMFWVITARAQDMKWSGSEFLHGLDDDRLLSTDEAVHNEDRVPIRTEGVEALASHPAVGRVDHRHIAANIGHGA